MTTWELGLSVTEAQVGTSTEVRTDLPHTQGPAPWRLKSAFTEGTSKGLRDRTLSLDACHYTPTWAVPGRLSLPYMECPRRPVTTIYMGCHRMPVTTLLHGLFQDTCRYTPTWAVARHLSLHIYMDCHRMSVTTHQHGLSPGYPSLSIYMDSLGHLSLHTSIDCPRMPVTTHLHGLRRMPVTILYTYITVPGCLSLYIYMDLSWESLVLGVRCLNSKPAHVLALLHFGISTASWST